MEIRYPGRYAPITEEEMCYLSGGSVIDDAVDTARSTYNALVTISAIVGVGVIATTYIWGIQQARDWLDDNAEGNLFTILGKAVDDLGADMTRSMSHFARDLVASASVVLLWPLSIPLLLYT